MATLAITLATGLQAAEPTWMLGRDAIAPAATTGKVEVVDGAVTLDGTNSFALPLSVLGDQSDYTVEFEVTRQVVEGRDDQDFFQIVSNMDAKAETGLAFGPKYYPPHWTSSSLSINGHPAISQKAFKPGTAYKVTLVAEEGRLMLFIDGLLLGMTDVVKPSARPLTFGELSKTPIVPYALRHIRIYNTAIVPTGYDASTEMMRTYSGDGYSMQRADITDATLPRILVIGDSISMGYRRYITAYFQDKAYVDYWVCPLMFRLRPEDVADADGKPAAILRAWTGVLANGPYDVVSWNHATLHMWDPGKPERCPEASYPANMATIVEHIRAAAPQTQFLWVRCTPIVTFDGTEKTPTLTSPQNERIVAFNALTDAVMKAHGIPLVDLYAIGARSLDKVSGDGIHWKLEAYEEMAKAICAAAEPFLRQE